MSTVQIGSVPLYADEATGEVFVDPADAQVGSAADEDDSGFLGLGAKAKARRIEKRIARLQRRRDKVSSKQQEGDGTMFDAAPADLYQLAASSGMVNENQFNGLGAVVVLKTGANATLQDTINRNLWGKSLVLDSDAPSVILVMAITIAGLPLNVGNQGTPLSMFATNSTRFGISFGRKLALTGQSVVVTLSNVDTANDHTVSGGIIADEMNPYAMQRWMEQMLLTAATSGFVDGY
jgi:hypothetical protein